MDRTVPPVAPTHLEVVSNTVIQIPKSRSFAKDNENVHAEFCYSGNLAIDTSDIRGLYE